MTARSMQARSLAHLLGVVLHGCSSAAVCMPRCTRIWSPSHLEDNNAGEGMRLPPSKFLCQKRERKKRERTKGRELYIACPIMLQFNWIARSKLVDHFTVCFENYTVVVLMSEREAGN